jgi:hypothetical protein
VSRAAFAVAGALALPALADTPGDGYKTYSLDLSVPESPAFAVLGVSPDNVVHPSSTRELAASLVNGVGKDGKVLAGLALDTAPYPLFFGDTLTLKSYRGNYVTRLLANTQLSLATAKAADSSDKGTRYGIGLHTKLYDQGDPRTTDYFDLPGCYDKAFQLTRISPADPDREKKATQKEKELQSAVVDCRKQAKKALWNRSSWLAGIATAWASEAGSGTQTSGTAAWTTYAYGFEKVPALQDSAQLLLHARLHNNEVVQDKSTATGFAKRNSWVGGTRLRVGGENLNFSAEWTYTRGKLDYGQTESVRRVALGGEYRITKDVWLVASVGGEGGFRDGSNKPFALGGLKFGSSTEPQF